MWYKHGGEANCLAYEKSRCRYKTIACWTFKDYYLDEKTAFVHAGFTNMNGVAYEFSKLFYWDRTLWETALSLDRSIKPNDMLYPNDWLCMTKST
jgi:serine/threonine protein phosphatase 1